MIDYDTKCDFLLMELRVGTSEKNGIASKSHPH